MSTASNTDRAPAGETVERISAAYSSLEYRRQLYTFILIIVFGVLMFAGMWQVDEANAANFADRIQFFWDWPLLTLDEARNPNEYYSSWFEIPFVDPRHLALQVPYIWLLVETINMAIVSTLIGFVLAFIVTMFASRNLIRNKTVVWIMRRILDVTRAFPEIVLALLLIYLVGGNATVAVVAIAFHTIGALGKLFSEVVENADMKAWEGLEAAGASWVQRVWFGIVPQVMPNFLSYALLRLEINVRASAIVGFVGAGGLGAALKTVFDVGYGDDLTSIIALLIVTIFAIDYISSKLRAYLINGASMVTPFANMIAAPLVMAVLAVAFFPTLDVIAPWVSAAFAWSGGLGYGAGVTLEILMVIAIIGVASGVLLALLMAFSWPFQKIIGFLTRDRNEDQSPTELARRGALRLGAAMRVWLAVIAVGVGGYLTVIYYAFDVPQAVSRATQNWGQVQGFVRDFYSYRVEAKIDARAPGEIIMREEGERTFIVYHGGSADADPDVTTPPAWVRDEGDGVYTVELPGGSITFGEGLARIVNADGEEVEILTFFDERVAPVVVGLPPEWLNVGRRTFQADFGAEGVVRVDSRTVEFLDLEGATLLEVSIDDDGVVEIEPAGGDAIEISDLSGAQLGIALPSGVSIVDGGVRVTTGSGSVFATPDAVFLQPPGQAAVEVGGFSRDRIPPELAGDVLPAWLVVTGSNVSANFGALGDLRITNGSVTINRYFSGWENFWFSFHNPLNGMSFGELWSGIWSDGPLADEQPEAMSNIGYVWHSFWSNPEWQHAAVWGALGLTILMAFLGTAIASLVGLPLAFIAARRQGPIERTPLPEAAATVVATLALAVASAGLVWLAWNSTYMGAEMHAAGGALGVLAYGGTLGLLLLSIVFAYVAVGSAYMSLMRVLAWALPIQFLHKKLFDILRAVDMLVWSLVFIRAFGLGPMSGTLAIAVTDTGTLGKLYSEAIENADKRQVEGVAATGASAVQRNWYGVFPQILPVFVSQGLYFLESNTRSATVIGILGAGGIGLKLAEAVKTRQDWENVLYMVVLIILVVVLMDTISGRLRQRLIKGGDRDLGAIIERQRLRRQGWRGDKGVVAQPA